MGTPAKQWWSVVGDNGFGYTCYEGVVLEGIKNLRNLSVMTMPNEEAARQYSFAAYFGRYCMRNYNGGQQPKLPVNLPPDCIFYDKEFDAREGNRVLNYFPGITF